MQVSSIRKLTDFKWLNLFSVSWENKGVKGEWTFASRKSRRDPRKEPSSPDAVVIAAVHIGPDGERRLVIVKQYRIPLGDYEYVFAAGLSESTPEEDARTRSGRRDGIHSRQDHSHQPAHRIPLLAFPMVRGYGTLQVPAAKSISMATTLPKRLKYAS